MAFGRELKADHWGVAACPRDLYQHYQIALKISKVARGYPSSNIYIKETAKAIACRCMSEEDNEMHMETGNFGGK